MGATRELDNAVPAAKATDKSYKMDVPAGSEATALHTESMALAMASSRSRAAADSADAANAPTDAAQKKPEPDHLEIPPMKELSPPAKADGVSQAHENLMDSAKKSFGDDVKALTAFEGNMKTYEARVKPDDSQNIVKTYAEVKRLLDTPSQIVSDQQRRGIAADVVDRAAQPLDSNQGLSSDCAAASIENVLYSKSPDVAAKYVADTVLSGKFADQFGNKVSVDNDTIAQNQGVLSADEASHGMEPRTHGDQIIQAVIRNEELALVNLDNGNLSDGKAGLKYEVREPSGFNETGEHIIDYSKNPPKDVTDEWGDGMRGDDIPRVMRDLAVSSTGKEPDDKDVLLRWSSAANLQQFKDALVKPDVEYPRLMGVNIAQEPFKTAMSIEGPGNVGFHAITLTSYDPKSNLIHYRNPVFGTKEFTTDADQMYNSMLVHQSDDDVTETGEGLKKDRATFLAQPKVASDFVYSYLQETEVSQRKEVLHKLSKASGLDVSKALSDAQQRELGVAPNVLDNLFKVPN